ncbi:MAG: helix-turn-helix domain-containing protein [Vicinamibacterales bacterium]|nr:helix-turn-helix domain-containing protein [Vicinamibacterales bacterium]
MSQPERPETPSTVLASVGLGGTPAPLREARRAFERAYITAVLRAHGGRVAEAARALGLQRPNLYRKARQLRIDLRRLTAGPQP